MEIRPQASAGRSSSLLAARSLTLGIFRCFFMSLSTVSAAPLSVLQHASHKIHNPEEDPSLWVLYVVSLLLVLLGGAFAGLTIALMGQDGIYLQVLSRDPTEPQHKNAKRVYDLLLKGKHWVLVTLLLANVVVNETLPVVLDRCFGGGVAAVVGSTVLIVIFGEILPQSICVRYGLQIGGYMSKPVLALMYITSPVAWPTAKLLDKMLGEDHGTVYKKSGLKTLVTLHKNLGEVSDRLNQDEVTIISAVLDLKEKPVEQVMTPMDDVFVMSEDTVLDEKTMDMILSAGYSRIPIHEPGNPTNFVGMLLVKILITYDPEDGMRVSDFPLATLPETRPETSCLDIVNFFQEGKSHMVLVSNHPGEDYGALGVVTLEDVIEELIGEEIIDESDVYIDVHKAIRRLNPAPRARVHRITSHPRVEGYYDNVDEQEAAAAAVVAAVAAERSSQETPDKGRSSIGAKSESPDLSGSFPTTTLMLRRSSSGADGRPTRTVRANIEEMKQHLRHLGPSNPATNPKNTRSTTVKIKPGGLSHPRPWSVVGGVEEEAGAPAERETETSRLLPLRTPPAPASDGNGTKNSPKTGYGSMAPSQLVLRPSSSGDGAYGDADLSGSRGGQPSPGSSQGGEPLTPGLRSSSSIDSVGNYRSASGSPGRLISKRPAVRSGSITENVIESRGIRKVVLETANGEEGSTVMEFSTDDGADSTTLQRPGSGSGSGSGSGHTSGAVEDTNGRSTSAGEGDTATVESVEGDQPRASSSKKSRKKKKKKGGR